MSSNTTTTYGGNSLGLGTVLTIVFVVLKLVGVIHWSWIWVLSPLWISFAIGLTFMILIAIIVAIATRNR